MGRFAATLRQDSAMARPTNLPIQGNLVRELRDQRGLTQAELATLVYRNLPDSERRHIPERSVLEKRCYEWEQENNISRVHLAALSTVLGVSRERLQGPPGPAPRRIEEIVHRLKEQHLAGNHRTHKFVADAAECIHFGTVPQVEDEDGPFRVAAEAIEVRLGSVQLTGGLIELEELGAVTAWTRAELLKPASMHAYWLVASESRLGGTTELVRGTSAAMAVINGEVERWFHVGDGDSRASLEEEAPWFRLHLQDPDRPTLDKTISFVRCEPLKTGLAYSTPTAHERWTITVRHALTLRNHFNFVRPLDDRGPWPQYQDMALELWDVSGQSGEGELVLLERIKGSLPELIEHYLPGLREERHQMVMGWLTSGLAAHLVPHLDRWPRECWRVSSGEQLIKISLDVPWEISRYLERIPTHGRRFALQLVQNLPDGTSTPLPLARSSMQVVRSRVNDVLAELPLDAEFVGPRRIRPIYQG